VFERAKTFHALDRAATLIGECWLTDVKMAILIPVSELRSVTIFQIYFDPPDEK
jgi:hypothetical protein